KSKKQRSPIQVWACRTVLILADHAAQHDPRIGSAGPRGARRSLVREMAAEWNHRGHRDRHKGPLSGASKPSLLSVSSVVRTWCRFVPVFGLREEAVAILLAGRRRSASVDGRRWPVPVRVLQDVVRCCITLFSSEWGWPHGKLLIKSGTRKRSCG